MKFSKSTYIIYSLILSVLCSVIIYYEWNNQNVKVVDKTFSSDPTFNQAPFGGNFTLQQVLIGSNLTKPFTLSSLKGKFVLLYFGYSYCPDICPQGLNNISRALKLLKRDRDKFVPIFVTVDPVRDTPEMLNIYSTNFDPAFIFLWGFEKDIEIVKKQYRVFAEKAQSEKNNDPMMYVINHSSYIYILDENGQFVQQISHDMFPEQMAEVFVSYLNQKNLLNNQK